MLTYRSQPGERSVKERGRIYARSMRVCFHARVWLYIEEDAQHLHVASSLPHHPYRRPFYRLPSQCPQQQRLLCPILRLQHGECTAIRIFPIAKPRMQGQLPSEHHPEHACSDAQRRPVRGTPRIALKVDCATWPAAEGGASTAAAAASLACEHRAGVCRAVLVGPGLPCGSSRKKGERQGIAITQYSCTRQKKAMGIARF